MVTKKDVCHVQIRRKANLVTESVASSSCGMKVYQQYTITVLSIHDPSCGVLGAASIATPTLEAVRIFGQTFKLCAEESSLYPKLYPTIALLL